MVETSDISRGRGRPTAAVSLTADERETLEGWLRRPTISQAIAQRARVVLAADTGETNASIGERLGMHPATVGKWRARFRDERIEGIADGRHEDGRASADDTAEGAGSATNGRSRLRPGEVRAKLLTAAAEVFCDRGFAGSSTREIAARAGVSETLVFRHFGSKAGLFERAVFDPFVGQLDQFHAKLESVLRERGPSRNLEEEYLGMTYDWVSDNRGLLMALLSASEYEDGIAGGMSTGAPPLIEALERGAALLTPDVAGADIDRIDTDVVSRVPFALLVGLILLDDWIYPPGGHPGRDRLVRGIIAMLETNLVVGGAASPPRPRPRRAKT